MIYGSGRGDAASPTEQPQETPMDPFSAINMILLAPLAPLAQAMGVELPGVRKAAADQARYNRSYMPQGGVRPRMTSTELGQKNIFGEGGTA
jgi:hypothetical protein